MLGSEIDVKKYLADSGVLFVGFEVSYPPTLAKVEIERGATYKMLASWVGNKLCWKSPALRRRLRYVTPRPSDYDMQEVYVDFRDSSNFLLFRICDTYIRAIHKS
ncbi:hypothetical protein KIN20_036215 [Parelaphostrongylus tenuis]|uniref:Uncharacterized protein n=1 Tax=Parelaphostrongylus tenuis TaxID=148309 RepID=A0AAD5RCM8_PARTN|nr:hypothetical protein KIN20_036215 [Parelaphostrongylus tenuis]